MFFHARCEFFLFLYNSVTALCDLYCDNALFYCMNIVKKKLYKVCYTHILEKEYLD